ncbi:MAG: hypothetical protein ABGY96_15255 [bacterium]
MDKLLIVETLSLVETPVMGARDKADLVFPHFINIDCIKSLNGATAL